jgi:hypothetical protein
VVVVAVAVAVVVAVVVVVAVAVNMALFDIFCSDIFPSSAHLLFYGLFYGLDFFKHLQGLAVLILGNKD